eukprot:10358189-Heterocapsa_arctica.AAC.1
MSGLDSSGTESEEPYSRLGRRQRGINHISKGWRLELMKTHPESTTSGWRTRNLWMLGLSTPYWPMEFGLLKELRREETMFMDLVSCVEPLRLELNTSETQARRAKEGNTPACFWLAGIAPSDWTTLLDTENMRAVEVCHPCKGNAEKVYIDGSATKFQAFSRTFLWMVRVLRDFRRRRISPATRQRRAA